MGASSYDEAFVFDEDFLRRYTFLRNKYLFSPVGLPDHGGYSVSNLVQDLLHQLGCLAVVFLRHSPGEEPAVGMCYPSDPEMELWIGGIVKQRRIRDCIDELLKTEYRDGSGISTMAQVPPLAGGKVDRVEVDFIPIPHAVDSGRQTDSVQMLMLVDPAALKLVANHQDERAVQRATLAHFFRSWWIRVTAPKDWLAGWILDRRSTPSYRKDVALLSVATLSELIAVGNQCAGDLRRYGETEKVWFDLAADGNEDFWQRWIPYSIVFERESNHLPTIRDRAKALYYWCRWIESHHDLEDERSSLLPRSLGEGDEPRPISKWVKQQREDIKKNGDIKRRLSDLRDVTARALESQKPDHLSIDRKSLLCFSLNQWLASSEALRRDLTNNIWSDVQFCRVLHGVGVVAQYLFDDPYQRDPHADDVIHRLMQLVAMYGHGQLGIPARLDLRAHLLQAARGETALHVLKPFYRDHFFHALEVCFLGHLLLEAKVTNRRPLWQLVADILGPKEYDRQRVLRVWYITALLHDVGYAMDVFHSSRKFFDFFHHSQALRQLVESFDTAVGQLYEEREVQELNIELEPGMQHDHGIIGALHLRSLLARIAEDDKSLNVYDYRPAIHAIAIHNLRRSCHTISFAKQPLAFLLALCDQLQDWRRPRLAFPTSPHWMLARMSSGYTPSPTDLEGGFKTMTTNLQALSTNTGDIELSFKHERGKDAHLAFTIEYDDRINWNSNVFHTWIDATLNFQRLDFRGLPLDVTVTYVTPFYRNRHSSARHQGSEQGQSQLWRLSNAAHETHMSFLVDWFPTREETDENGRSFLTNGAVTYYRDDWDELTLDLNKLSEKALVTRDMDAFRQHLQQWKEYNDDREFPGDYVPVIPE